MKKESSKELLTVQSKLNWEHLKETAEKKMVGNEKFHARTFVNVIISQKRERVEGIVFGISQKEAFKVQTT